MSNKRNQIFEAVINCIKTEGLLSNITMSKIAKKADIGKGTIYEYFTSKDEMLAETLMFMLEQTFDKIKKQYNSEENFHQILHSHIKTVMNGMVKNSTVHTILMAEDVGGLINHEYKQKIMCKIMGIKKDYHQLLTKIFEKGVNENLFTPVNDPFIIVAVSNSIVSSIMYFIHENHPYQEDEFVDKIYQLILKIVQ